MIRLLVIPTNPVPAPLQSYTASLVLENPRLDLFVLTLLVEFDVGR
jgi:hypothetical protein